MCGIGLYPAGGKKLAYLGRHGGGKAAIDDREDGTL